MNAVTRAHVAVRRYSGFALFALILLNAAELLSQTTTCLPSCSSTDGRFLSLAGTKYSTLAGDEISISLCAPSGSSTIAFDVFDGETGGLWDAGTAPLIFKLFVDSAGTGTGTTKIGEWKGDIMSDNNWFSVSMSHDSRALAPTGRYFYVLKIRIAWGDDADANNVEDDVEDAAAYSTWSNFKIRSLSTMGTKQFSFAAPLFTTAEANIIYPNYPLLTSPTYDGTWSMYFNVPEAMSSLEIWDGDMDFGSYDGTAVDRDDANTTGNAVPRWSGTGAANEGRAGGKEKVRNQQGQLTTTVATGSPSDDNLSLVYRRSPSVTYQVIDPNGRTYTNDNPSGNLEWERFVIGTATQDSTVDTAAAYLPAGTYEIAISGMDMHNLNSWRYSAGIAGVTSTDSAVIMPEATCVDNLGRRVSTSSQAEHMLEIWSDGSIYATGENDYGQLGDNSITDRTSLVRVRKGDYNGATYLGDSCNGVLHAAPGHCHSLAIMNDGSVYAWGHNDEGQLGINNTTNYSVPKRTLKGAYPGTTYLGDNPNNPMIWVDGGFEYSAAVSRAGLVYMWGDNIMGQLGDSSTTDRLTPVRVTKGLYSGTRYLGDNPYNPIIAVSAGKFFTVALAADGTVYSWGLNSVGQLGDNSTTYRASAVRVLKGAYAGTTYLGDNSANKIIAVSALDSSCVALAADGTVYTWGKNNYGQLGDGTTTNRSVPVKVLEGAYPGITYLGDSTTNKIVDVSAGAHHVVAVSGRGRVYTWGRNNYGQLGDNSTTNRTSPVAVRKGVYSGTTYLGDGAIPMERIGTGGDHSIALSTSDNKTYTWGFGDQGRMGHGLTSNSSTPVLVLQGARPSAKVTSHEVVTAESAPSTSSETGEEPNPTGMTISAIGVYDYADQVYMTIDSEGETTVDIDIYSIDGVHIAKALQGQQFASGRQRFGVGLPKKLRSGKYILRITNERGTTAKTFVLSR